MVEILPGLHTGAAPSRRGLRSLVRAGVSYVVDLREAPRTLPWPTTVSVLRRPLTEYEAPDVAWLARMGGEVAMLVNRGEVVYVHCRAGVQRGPLVACATLMQMGWALSDAYRIVAARHAATAMSEAQLGVLRDLDGWNHSERVQANRSARTTSQAAAS